MQRGAGALVDHPQPGDQRPGGQPLLIGGVDLPGLVRPLGPAAGLGPGPPRRGRGQAVLVQPSPEGPVGGDLDPRGDPAQLDADAGGPPAGVAAAEVQDRLEQGRGRAGATAAGVIAGGQAGDGLALGLGPPGAADQVAGRAHRQSESSGDLGRVGPEAGHLSDGQSQRQIGGAWHGGSLRGSKREGIPGLYPTAESHGTFASGFHTEQGVR